jgi:hypothetical protein
MIVDSIPLGCLRPAGSQSLAFHLFRLFRGFKTPFSSGSCRILFPTQFRPPGGEQNLCGVVIRASKYARIVD